MKKEKKRAEFYFFCLLLFVTLKLQIKASIPKYLIIKIPKYTNTPKFCTQQIITSNISPDNK